MIPASCKRSNHSAKVLLLILATASCRDIGAPQVETMEGGGFPVFKSMISLPGDYIDVQEGGESIIEYDDDTSATSRCPDEARIGLPHGVVLQGRTLRVAAVDPDDGRLTHFVMESRNLRDSHYESRGVPISKAWYRLAQGVLSEDLQYFAPPSAMAKGSGTVVASAAERGVDNFL